MDRRSGVGQVASVLQKAGFFLFDLHTSRPSPFDLIARRDSALLLIKVLKNIDAFGPEESEQLRLLGRLLGGTPLVVGGTSGGHELPPGVLFSRHSVAVITPATLEDFLLNGVPPFLFSSPGGIFARLDGRKLRKARDARSLSLGALADVAGVSRRTIQLYEEDAGAEMEIVRRLERFLGVTLAAPLDPFDPSSAARGRDVDPEPPTPRPRTRSWSDTIFHELDEAGWSVTVTIRSPFDALARDRAEPNAEILVMGVGDLETAQKRSGLLAHIARVAEGTSAFVVPDRKDATNIDGTPVVSHAELKRRRGPEELRELLDERTGP